MSLIELVVAIVVMSIALTGTMLLVDTTTRRSANPVLERQAISIAEAYLAEILQKDYLDPDSGNLCPSAEASRANYDNICDYDGLDELGARDQNGRAIPGLEPYRIEVDIDRTANLGGISGSAEVLRVDAAVTEPTGRIFRFSAYRTNP